MNNEENNTQSVAGKTQDDSSTVSTETQSKKQLEEATPNPWIGKGEEYTGENSSENNLPLSKDTKTIIVKKTDDEK